jgi:peptidoglycan hydrolase-like protein with peptidoglycan-binding domain
MNRKFLATVLLVLIAWSTALADPAVESAQQKLKEGGFYYGEINGKKDADTTAAIRRYQIRNGLQITGELNAETQRSLGLASKPAPTQAPVQRPAPSPAPTPPGFLEEEDPAPRTTPIPRSAPAEENESDDEPEPQQPPPPSHVEGSRLFQNTPYENAPPHVQQDVVSRAQLVLMRRGYYREGIDGLYGPALNFALRNYQARFGLEPSGRFDVETLGALGLLPEQQRTTGFRRFPRRFPPPIRIGPGHEPIYIPR